MKGMEEDTGSLGTGHPDQTGRPGLKHWNPGSGGTTPSLGTVVELDQAVGDQGQREP